MNEKYLGKAIELARNSIQNGGGPFGAVIVKDNVILSTASNSVTKNNDPTAHAEILAIRKAAEKTGHWNLDGCVLYSSCEPCPMCLGAAYWAHIDTIYFAAGREDAKNAGFDDSLIYSELILNNSQRALPIRQLLEDKGREIFRLWLNTPDRKEY